MKQFADFFSKKFGGCLDCQKKHSFPKKIGFDYKLFIFAYLFNDLVMLFFSSRFFETVVDPFFMKMCVFLFALYLCSKFIGFYRGKICHRQF